MCSGFLCLAFLGLLGRLWFLQVVQGPEKLAEAQRNRIRDVPLPAPRGLVLDRHDKVLATSRASHSVAVVPAALPSKRREPEERKKVLSTLAFLLKTTPAEIERRLQEASERGGHSYDPVRIAENVDLNTITLIEENKPRLLVTRDSAEREGVLVTDDITRSYPNGALAAHVLGYTGNVTEKDLKRSEEAVDTDPNARQLRFDDIIGKDGIESMYDEELTGTRGSEQYEVDARSRPVRHLGSIKEKPGRTVVLTLDTELQRAAEQALRSARNSGAAVAIDPRNGEVLVMASNPTFDPNLFSLPRRQLSAKYSAARKNAKKVFRNRAVQDHFPPGSTFKMITSAAGLEKGVINPQVSYQCGGSFRMGRSFGCWKTHGTVNLAEAIAQSCDVYFYQAALSMGNPESSGPYYLAKIARQFGLGHKTGIDLPVDGAGLIPDPAWRRRINPHNPDLAHWYPGNTLNMSIGQGDVLATPLQMAMVTSAVANGGTLWQPHLLKEIRNGKEVTRTVEPQGHSTGISQENIDLIRSGMRRVVTNGTGKSVALPQVAIAGKTGSAEDANHALPHAWFVCFAPYDHPRIAIAVIVENSGHGSENAVPIVKKILEAAFPAKKKGEPSHQPKPGGRRPGANVL
jgi:penicillin-binding protein 2